MLSLAHVGIDLRITIGLGISWDAHRQEDVYRTDLGPYLYS